jgi:hypothetical protein
VGFWDRGVLGEFYFTFTRQRRRDYKRRNARIDSDCLTAKARDLSGMLNESPVKEHFVVPELGSE